MDDPVCIVGIGCNLPGGVRSPAGFWDVVLNKKSEHSQVPPDRFNISGYCKPGSNQTGIMNCDGGYFLDGDVRHFENTFFGINNVEATYMDPQQRKILEVVYECFENAGVSLDSISGTNTGVYVGSFTYDYAIQQGREPDYAHRYSATGIGSTIMSNRISHIFNLQGPSLTLDTACSSSMYAFHLAVSAIKAGECEGAIVAGANLIQSPEQHYLIYKAGVLSPTSTCHTFDASADGYGRAEGINAVYIKRLSHALRDNDHVWAVVRATAVNADGRTPGITQPSSQLQAAVIRKAYKLAGLDVAYTDYFECHGTGTAVGDPTEIDGIAQVFTSPRHTPLLIGSAKTNFGHSEAAAGLTSIIKVSLAFENSAIPPTHGVNTLNPSLRLESRGMQVVTEHQRWPRSVRRSSINSFGYGGANAHTILESLSSYLGHNDGDIALFDSLDNDIFILPVSSASHSSLVVRMENIRGIIPNIDFQGLRRLAFTLGERRTHFPARDYILARADNNGCKEVIPTGIKSHSLKTDLLPFVFVFTGQGAQSKGMAKELLLYNATFIASIRRLDTALRKLPLSTIPTWSLEELLRSGEDTAHDLHDAAISQPLCTAIQIGLVDVMSSWGILPTAVVGHSSGEIAAAYAAGFMDSTLAIQVAYLRGFAVSRMQSKGAMVAVKLTVTAAQELLESRGLESQICIACVNSPESLTLSGASEAINEVFEVLKSQGTFARKLLTGDRAYHSPMMAEVGQLYEDLIRPLFSSPTRKKSLAHMFSSVGRDGEQLVDPRESTDMAKYWRENLEKPVQFQLALTKAVTRSNAYLIEVGPHPALQGAARQTLAALNLAEQLLPYAPTLVRGQEAHHSMQELCGKLFSQGYELKWEAVNNTPKTSTRIFHQIPPYPWDYSSPVLWYEPRPSSDFRNRKYPRHELLGLQQLAGNGIDSIWRNALRLDEVSWLLDHKVESQTVFPATGYLALAIEGLRQVIAMKDTAKDYPTLSFEFRNVNIKTALILDSANENNDNIELHTHISPTKLSTATASATWFDFSVSSWSRGRGDLHCAGAIRRVEQSSFSNTTKIHDHEQLETRPLEPWYNRLQESGLSLGPTFQSLTTLRVDGGRINSHSIATSKIKRLGNENTDTSYLIHPITIDSCLQAGIMASARGDVDQMQAFLPTFISECQVSLPKAGCSNEGTIHAVSRQTGISTQRIDCTLYRPDYTPVIDMRDVRLELYSVRNMAEDTTKPPASRRPGLRVQWKPDLGRVRPAMEDLFRDYIHSILADSTSSGNVQGDSRTIGALLDLAGHKIPGMDVLVITDSSTEEGEHWLNILGQGEAFPRYKSWKPATVNDEGKLAIDNDEDQLFDTVIIRNKNITEAALGRALHTLVPRLSDDGIIITDGSETALCVLGQAGLSVVSIENGVIVAVRPPLPPPLEDRDVILLCRKEISSSTIEIRASLEKYLREVARASDVRSLVFTDIAEHELSERDVYISLLEVECELLATITQSDLEFLQQITNSAKNLLWLTGADVLCEPNPDLTLSNGLSRALMLEQPSLHFSVLDIGSPTRNHRDSRLICESILSVLSSCFRREDTEFVLADGLVWVSRLYEDSEFNTMFRRQLGTENPAQRAPLAAASPARLAIGKVGVTDTLYFQMEMASDPPPGFVDIETKAFGLNAKDVYAMAGRVETRGATNSLEFSGIIKTVGPGADTDRLKPGDRVVVMAPNHSSTVNRVPAWTVHKMLPDEDFNIVATLPVAYSTALYALCNRANLRAGESVLIHSGAGGLGIAAIRVAQRIGAVVFTTVSTKSKQEFLERELGLPSSHIFHSRDESFVKDVKRMTGGKGVNVVLNSLTGDLLHASWGCISRFGRFVEVGKRDLIDAGRLDMHVFLQNSTFTAFDLSEMFYDEDKFYRDLLVSKVDEVLTLYRSGEIQALPITTFDVSEIFKAYRHFSSREHIGKIGVSLENPNTQIMVSPPKYWTQLSPNKSFLMVGCLGGLGRSLTRWMVARGARKFVFLSRSGVARSEAQSLIKQLESNGVNATIIKGNVATPSDVTAAIAACEVGGTMLGGVVQGAMALHEALFTNMTSEAWHTTLEPKWKGTWCLHKGLEGHDKALDFFLLMSSVNGTISWATESNYSAANVFLNTFSSWSRRQGMPTIALGLGMVSEVGYIHENAHIESLLLRRGLVAFNEKEFLQIVDIALTRVGLKGGNKKSGGREDPGESNIVTGLELEGTFRLIDQGFEVMPAFGEDRRASLLLSVFEAEQRTRAEAALEPLTEKQRYSTEAPWWGDVPESAAEILKAQSDAPTLRDAILRVLRKQFSTLMLMPLDNVENSKSMMEVGVDSMIASEFRAWLWKSFRTDVTLLDLLGPRFSLEALAKAIESGSVQF